MRSLLLVLALLASDPLAAASKLLVAAPERLGEVLAKASRDGWHPTHLATPNDRQSLPDSVFAIVTQRPGATVPVLVVESDPLRAVEAIEGAAARGLALVDVTLATGRFGRTFVAVFEEHSAPPAIRFIRTTGQAREWKVLETAFRDGFGIRRILSLPDPTANATGEVVFVLEAGRGASGTEIDLAFASNEAALTKALARLAGKGFLPTAAWTGTTQVSVLVSRAPGVTSVGPAPLDFDPLGAGLGDGPMGCALVALLPFEDQEVAICGAGTPSRRATFETEVLDRDLSLTNDPWDAERVDQRLRQWESDRFELRELRLRRDAEKHLRLWLLAEGE